MTTALLLKILSVLVVAGCIFCYYIDDLKDRLTSTRRNIWRLVAAVLVVGSIVVGFSVLGTPQSQRMIRYDNQKVSDLQNIQWQIVNYWQQKGVLPSTLLELQDPISGFIVPVDPQTQSAYEYARTGTLVFNLCAEFNKSGQQQGDELVKVYPASMGTGNENWQYEAGRTCFSRTIDPELYPVRTK